MTNYRFRLSGGDVFCYFKITGFKAVGGKSVRVTNYRLQICGKGKIFCAPKLQGLKSFARESSLGCRVPASCSGSTIFSTAFQH